MLDFVSRKLRGEQDQAALYQVHEQSAWLRMTAVQPNDDLLGCAFQTQNL